MKESKYTQCVLCEGRTFQGAVEKFNIEMQRLSDYNPTYERAGKSFLIYYTIRKSVPEDIVEMKMLQGCRDKCEECAHCIRQKTDSGKVDKRTKRSFCELHNTITWIDSTVCEEFYMENLRKEVQCG